MNRFENVSQKAFEKKKKCLCFSFISKGGSCQSCCRHQFLLSMKLALISIITIKLKASGSPSTCFPSKGLVELWKFKEIGRPNQILYRKWCFQSFWHDEYFKVEWVCFFCIIRFHHIVASSKKQIHQTTSPEALYIITHQQTSIQAHKPIQRQGEDLVWLGKDTAKSKRSVIAADEQLQGHFTEAST